MPRDYRAQQVSLRAGPYRRGARMQMLAAAAAARGAARGAYLGNAKAQTAASARHDLEVLGIICLGPRPWAQGLAACGPWFSSI